VDAKGLLQFLVNGSFGLLTEIADGASDAEWQARSFPSANLVGFTVWHCARTIDWAVNCVMRGAPELADQAEWQDLQVAAAMFGAGASREAADDVARHVPRTRVSAYLKALRQGVVAWLAALPNEDLSGAVDLKARHVAKAEYMTPAVWAELEDLDGLPGWQFLARPCVSHIRVHYGEVSNQLGALRTAAPTT
jgi:DinB superfamily